MGVPATKYIRSEKTCGGGREENARFGGKSQRVLDCYRIYAGRSPAGF